MDAALKATAALTRELKKARTGAERGQLRDLRRALSAATLLAAEVLSGKNDREVLPGRLRDKQTAEYAEMAGLAEVGMRHLERDLVSLVPPDATELDRAYRTLRRLHAGAYGWEPPDIPGLEQLGATRMRQYVRAWINEWDLVRLDPGYQPVTDVVEVPGDYRELAELNDDRP